MAKHNILGKWGEDLATEYLITQGYTIRERNWRVGRMEADIIATKGNRLIIIEVKTRSDDLFDPMEAIDARRRARMISLFNAYLRFSRLKMEYQFDYVFVIGNPLSPEPPKIEHLPDAFRPKLRTYR